MYKKIVKIKYYEPKIIKISIKCTYDYLNVSLKLLCISYSFYPKSPAKRENKFNLWQNTVCSVKKFTQALTTLQEPALHGSQYFATLCSAYIEEVVMTIAQPSVPCILKKGSYSSAQLNK